MIGSDAARGSVLLTGASGNLGALIAAALLAGERETLLLPVRASHTAATIAARVGEELRALGREPQAADLERLVVLPLPPPGEVAELAAALAGYRVREIVHSAGCLDYFDLPGLQAGNVDLTREVLALGARLGVERFTFISTSFSSGFVSGVVPEALHPEPDADPTEYTRSKRAAERLVAASGLPYLILRPALVIGDSRDGRYRGKPYGLYQLWALIEQLAGDYYVPEVHLYVPRQPAHFLHQDAFQAAFLAAWRHLPPGAIAHLVPRQELLPTAREICTLGFQEWTRPRTIYYYGDPGAPPPDKLDRRQRLLFKFASVNLEGSAHPWWFETGALDALHARGLAMPDTTLASVAVCQRRYMADSPRVQEYLARFAAELAAAPRVIELDAANPWAGAG